MTLQERRELSLQIDMLLPMGRTRKTIQVSAAGIALEGSRAFNAEQALAVRIDTEITYRNSEDTRR